MRFLKFIVCISLFLTSSYSFALQHQPLGVLGMQPGSAPAAKGLYSITTISNITADKTMDADGNEKHNDFNFDMYTISNLFIYVTDINILGGKYFTKITIPVILDKAMSFDAGPGEMRGNTTGLDDIDITPLAIGWHNQKFDAVFESTVFLPVGEYHKDDEMSSVGKDHYTLLMSVGGTYFFDSEKKHYISAKLNYETNSENDETDFTEGDFIHTAFGLGFTAGKGTQVGLAGYYLKQITDDKGSDGIKTNDEEVWSIGPEISTFLPGPKVNLKIRFLQEFNAVDRSEGKQVRIVIGKKF